MNERRKTLGLVLGAGGARGACHVGVIKMLEKNGIPIDYIAGSSMAVVVRDWSAGLPEYLSFLSSILGGAVFIISLLLSVVIAISALGVIYECFGGVFFDALIEKFAEKYYGKTTVIRDMKFNISFMFASLWYGVKTLLISLPLLLLAVI